MAAVLAGANVEEEYLWSCTLSAASKVGLDLWHFSKRLVMKIFVLFCKPV